MSVVGAARTWGQRWAWRTVLGWCLPLLLAVGPWMLLCGALLTIASAFGIRHYIAAQEQALLLREAGWDAAPAADAAWTGPWPEGLPGTAPALLFPLPARAPVSSPFGSRIHPIRGVPDVHSGVDYAAYAGTPVLAAAEGVVLSAGPLGGYGNAVRVAHGGHVMTLYAHLSAVLVRAGARVRAGQPVGLVGSTGVSTGPHLHFEVRVDGEAVDPDRMVGR